MEKLSRLAAIRRYFELDGGRKLNVSEIKALSEEERTELALLCAVELGCEIEMPLNS